MEATKLATVLSNCRSAIPMLRTLLVSILTLGLLAATAHAAPDRDRAQALYSAGNYKDAYNLFREMVLAKDFEPRQISSDLSSALSCLSSLGRSDETDQLLEEVVVAHPNDWRALYAVATQYHQGSHSGTIVAGKFYRGNYRDGGRYVDSATRDRVRSLQLLVRASELAQDESELSEVAAVYWQLSDVVSRSRDARQAWKLQHLTTLEKLPDYDDHSYYGYQTAVGAPVGEDGLPIYYSIPKTFLAAKSDGERFRWALHRYTELYPGGKDQVSYYFAEFLLGQFGVETLADYSSVFRRVEDDATDSAKSLYALHLLSDDETIAKLATGIKRFKLPSEFNPIKLFQSLTSDESQNRSGYAENATDKLCGIFENRRQFERAAACWKQGIKNFGPGHDNRRQKQIDQIIGAWGQFEPVPTQDAGETRPSFEYRFRNGTSVALEAYEIKIDQLLSDIRTYLKDNPKQADHNRISVEQIGFRLVQEQAGQYRGQRAASWVQALKPRENHFDTRVTIDTPLKKVGAYLLKAKIAGGNESFIVMWIADAAIIKKPLDQGAYFYLGDATNGAPLPQAEVEFFGYKTEYINNNSLVNKVTGRTYNILTASFRTESDENGQVTPEKTTLDPSYAWIVTARTQDGRRAFLGFTNVWYGNYYDAEYNQTKVFTVTDRPVYRPEQSVKYKIWIANAKYDQERSLYADQSVTIQIRDPKGDKIQEQSLRTDRFGGVESELKLAKNAALGVYSFGSTSHGMTGTFRVEEYKKPEFEVKVEAPVDPITLGEKFTAKIEAKYYFGSPVTQAKVKYKVLRSGFEASWYPAGSWDWMYGVGYWWFSYDYPWFPGWKFWGCRRPLPWWWTSQTAPPEVVFENEVPIGPDGIVKVEIDSAVAKALHGDQDHRYQISAEVTDQSRRTITGAGEVLAARNPFKVYAWVDRGHYRAGDVVHAQFLAQTVANKPVQGSGALKLLKISYSGEKAQESVVEEWKLNTNDEGRAALQIKAASLGQYRLSYTVTDKAGHTIEGGYLFTVVGTAFDSSNYRFNDIELIPEKREYAPDEKVRLLINTNVPDSTVLLFLRPANGLYLRPEVIRIKGKSAVREIAVTKKDMPNFFVEAVTIGGAKVFTEVKEIVVPPEKRVLNVTATPSKEQYKPGEKAKISFKLTDIDGRPFVGAAALSVYDKALEYISGGSNVPEIKAFFWKWRRSHHSTTESSLDRYGVNLIRENTTAMMPIGVFGAEVADEGEANFSKSKGRDVGSMQRLSKSVAKRDRAGAKEESEAGGMAMDMAAPASAPQSLAANAEGLAEKKDQRSEPGQAGAPPAAAPMIRKEFADTAFWAGSLVTNDSGEAEVEFSMPENLTEWKVRVWGIGEGTRVGEGEASVVTTKNVIIRLQAPRFLVERDEVVLSGNVHNYLPTEQKLEAKIDLDTELLELLDPQTKQLTVPSKGEVRVDWRVKVLREGDARVRMSALGAEESDAMELKVPVHVHGMLKTESFSGAIAPNKERAELTFKVPAERRPDQSRLEVRYSPSLAAAMVDALPYLASYPYGCTEQTLSRFLPTVITQKVLRSMKLDLAAIRDKRTNLNAQEIGDSKTRAGQWKRYVENPVFDEDAVADMVKVGLDRLAAMQLSDGGWGWFSGYGEHSSPHTTAHVVHGLQVAQAAGVNVDSSVLSRGVAWLKNYQAGEVQKLKNARTKTDPFKNFADDLDAYVSMVLVDGEVSNPEMREFLFRDRTHLAVYSKAMFGLSLFKEKEQTKLAEVLKNIEQYLVQDEENQTAYLRLPADNYWWYWYGSEIEAMSYYLKLLAHVSPQGQVAPRLVKYLLNNRKHATYWNSTRDTATAIEAFADYLKESNELEPNLTVEIVLDGKKVKEVHVTKENLFTFDNTLLLTGLELKSGEHKLEVRKSGKGPLYFNAYLSNFTLEDFITKAGLEIKVNRKMYKLRPSSDKALVAGAQGQALEQRVDKYDRTEIASEELLKSGDLIEVELEIDSKNDYEYLVFEDLKPAGFEPVEVRSGYNGNDMGAYVEFRDDRVGFFTRVLSRGKHSIAYRVRAEIPGRFSALPTLGYAMYAPELKANSDEFKVRIED